MTGVVSAAELTVAVVDLTSPEEVLKNEVVAIPSSSRPSCAPGADTWRSFDEDRFSIGVFSVIMLSLLLFLLLALAGDESLSDDGEEGMECWRSVK